MVVSSSIVVSVDGKSITVSDGSISEVLEVVTSVMFDSTASDRVPEGDRTATVTIIDSSSRAVAAAAQPVEHTRSISIIHVNQAPVLLIEGVRQRNTYVRGSDGVPLLDAAADVALSDPDDDNMFSLSVRVTNGCRGDDDELFLGSGSPTLLQA